MRQVALPVDVIEVRQIPSRGPLVRRQIVIAAGRDALELRPAKRELVLDVKGAARVVRQLVLVMLPEPQALTLNAQPQVPLEPFLLPEVEPGHLLGGRHEELQLHLLELAQPEDRVARRDLVAERLANLSDAEGRPHV